MKFFTWMHKKLQRNSNQQLIPTASDNGRNQEQGKLLSIGTFGNHEIREKPSIHEHDDDFTQEEVGQLQKELRKLLRKKETVMSSNMSCCCSSSSMEEVIIDRTIRVIIDRCKTVCRERGKDEKFGSGKKLICFLFNKMFFVCGNAFNPSPPSTLMRDSRMEKLVRTMLSKKFNCSQNSTMVKRKQLESESFDEIMEKENGHQWVKTDSEYIVLVI